MATSQMFKRMTHKRCACRVQDTDQSGKPVFKENGEPKMVWLNRSCPQLSREDHGSWYYSFELPYGADGKRRPRAEQGGFKNQGDAAEEAERIWKAADKGINVVSKETVAEFLARWIKRKKLDLKRSTAHEYEQDIKLYLAEHLGALRINRLHSSHIQEMFDWIVAENERRIDHREKVEMLKAATSSANAAWRAAPKEERAAKRAEWNEVKAAYEEARRGVRRLTGPSTMLSIKSTLSSALGQAVKEELISKNYAQLVTLPKVTKPRAMLWTPERVARYERTGQKPSPVMVWTLEQTAEFLDFAREDRHFPLWHLVVFRGLRRGEAAAITWDELDLKRGVLHVTEQLVSVSYEVHEDTPKADSIRTIQLDQASVALLKAWRKKQRAERAEWEEAHAWVNSGNRVFTKESGEAYHPQFFTDRWERLVELSGQPPIRLHDGRHQAGAIAHASGAAPKTIQAMLGHSSLRMTMDTYTLVMPELNQAVADASVELIEQTRKRLDKKKAKRKKKDVKKVLVAAA